MAIASQPQKAGFPLTLPLDPIHLRKPAWVKISQIRTLSIERIGKRLGNVEPELMAKIIDGFNQIIGI
jgi:mRNA interferase MazF